MDLKLISKYREELFGISIISIIIFHFCEDYVLAFKAGAVDANLVIFGFYKIISSVGVEAFMLLSGFGLFFSMSRGGELKDFYKRDSEGSYFPTYLWGSCSGAYGTL